MPDKKENFDLDDKIKALDSSRVYKKITPSKDASWYIKWVSSIILLFGMVLTSVGPDYYPFNLILHLVGVIGWLIVGMLWHDRAIIFINTVGAVIFLTGILQAL
ncbi:MAG: hypothetical protein QGH83_00130 [Candidatus Pacebacteria bacterium]|jgi:hypothetical protein|nr:hypothetical protein [Candidatus Paceibacterota bacterium]|tara:strand:- start:2372 stop:2683 length:312 start_codon:yes stop_codon:yes gene_type:complete